MTPVKSFLIEVQGVIYSDKSTSVLLEVPKGGDEMLTSGYQTFNGGGCRRRRCGCGGGRWGWGGGWGGGWRRSSWWW
ncbi:hypothetical protein GCM10012278_17920 [Nonomuraea glycinis]|uniref:Uncharacterized protein n=1 Tax=Nonomuraea glycinis TaxID=2047744 RepID=A0A918A438_9ACTN|nr:hypothetical protein GCM10012278_17920 [Nonomuraea glycinis]